MILVPGGLAAHLACMDLTGVVLAAFVGSLCGDQFFFFLCRRHSRFVLNRRPAWKPRLERANRLIDRFQTRLILGFRFLYGLRTAMPFRGKSIRSAGGMARQQGLRGYPLADQHRHYLRHPAGQDRTGRGHPA